MRAKEPELVLNSFYKKGKVDRNNPKSSMNICPSFNGFFHNVFGMKSIYEYEFFIDTEKQEVASSVYDQNFFNRHVVVRDFENRLFSFSQSHIFFTEEESLLASFEYPFFEDNNITQRCLYIPGQFDIGKWYRSTDFAFYLKDGFNTFKIEENEIYQYVRFHTKEKVILKEYYPSNKVKEYAHDVMNSKGILRTKLEDHYKNFKIKNLILKEIKNNI